MSLPPLLSKQMASGLPPFPFLPREVSGHQQSAACSILRAIRHRRVSVSRVCLSRAVEMV